MRSKRYLAMLIRRSPPAMPTSRQRHCRMRPIRPRRRSAARGSGRARVGPATATPGGRDAPRGPGVAGPGALSGWAWRRSWGGRRWRTPGRSSGGHQRRHPASTASRTAPIPGFHLDETDPSGERSISAALGAAGKLGIWKPGKLPGGGQLGPGSERPGCQFSRIPACRAAAGKSRSGVAVVCPGADPR